MSLLAGFAKIDITPEYAVGLGGYSNAESRRSEGVEARIYTTCIALTDGDETILVYTIDNCACSHEIAEKIREVVSPATDIPGEKIFCSATHTHNAPSFFGHPEAKVYMNEFLAACTKAAKQALADQAAATVKAAKKSFPGMNYVRHVMLENGTVAGYNWRTYNSPIADFFGTIDSEMILVKFCREEKRDIVLINWQGHPDCSKQIGFHLIAPSFPGPLRDTVETGSGAHVAYFTGADGDMIIDCKKFFPEKAHGLEWRRYGVKMGSLALEMLEDMVEVPGSGIDTRRAIVEVEVDHSWDHMLEQANEVFDLWKATDKPTGDELGKKYDFSSVYQARAIRSRYHMGKTMQLELNAFRVGGVGFTTGTYEMFAHSGVELKTGSPYEFTLLLTGNSSYIPHEEGCKHRCYESDTGFYAIGTAEKLVGKYLEMLKEMQ